MASVGVVNRLPTQPGTWTGPVLRSPVTDRENRDEWVAILNRSLAERAIPGEDPLGKEVQALWDRREEDFTVVGVVAEGRDWRREAGGQPEIYLYWPQPLENTGYMTAVLRPARAR